MGQDDTPKAGDDEPVIYDYDPRNIPPEFLRAIGLVAASAAQTERMLQDFIGALLKIDQFQAIALAAHMSFPLKETVIRTLAEMEAPTVNEVDAIDDLLDAVKTELDKRNVIVHNSLAMHPKTGEVFSYRERARNSLQISLQPISVEEIEKAAASIYEVGMDVMSFMITRGIGPRDRGSAPAKVEKRTKSARNARRNSVVGDSEG